MATKKSTKATTAKAALATQQVILNVLLDNGHGKDTAGKRSPKWPDGTQLFEYDFNRKVVQKLFDLCKACPYLNPVILVPEDNDIKLDVRCQRANKYDKATSIFISIHGDAWKTADAHGITVFTSPGQTKADELAEFIYLSLQDFMPDMKMRPDMTDGDHDREESYYVLMKTKMPAVLTENGFYTNEEECHKMMTDAYQQRIADATFLAIRRYYKANFAKN
jgi:N-acetylmuramoyl-L-alanine amidase